MIPRFENRKRVLDLFLVCLISGLGPVSGAIAHDHQMAADRSVSGPQETGEAPAANVPQADVRVPNQSASITSEPAGTILPLEEQAAGSEERRGTEEESEAAMGAPEAEEPESARELKDLSIEELMEIEVDTVVSASRYRQKVSEAPSSISIITAGEIQAYGYRTLADILRSVRGFYTSYDRNYHYLGVRGFGRLGDKNTRVLLLIDGHRANDSIYDSAAVGTDFLLDPDLIERVEVTRGPGSSLYGSNAFFGVVNVVIRRGKDLGGAEASVEAGNFGASKARTTYGGGGTQQRDFLASVSGASSEGDRLYFKTFDQTDPFSEPFRSVSGGYADAADYDRSRSGYVRYDRGGVRFSAAYSERTKGVPTGASGSDFNTPGNRTVDTRGYVDVQYGLRTDDAAEYTVRAYLDHYRHEGDFLYYQSGYGLNKDRADGLWFGGEARAMKRLLPTHRVVGGMEYEQRKRQDQWNGDVTVLPTVFLDDHRSSRTWAAYIQDEISISPIFLLYAGIRHDRVSTFGGTTNPRLAAVINPVERGTLKLLYGRAFRAPTVYELYYAQPALSVLSNPDLKPEKIETYELVYEHAFDKGWYAAISRYSYRIRDLITQVYDSSFKLVYRNQEKAEATGTELELRKTWDGGSGGRCSYAYQKAEDPNSGDILANSPRHLAKLAFLYPVKRERVWAGIEEQYTGSRFTQAGRKAPGYAVTNMTLLVRNRKRTLEASASIYNVLAERYEDPVSIDLVPLDTVPQDGRTFRIKVTYAF